MNTRLKVKATFALILVILIIGAAAVFAAPPPDALVAPRADNPAPPASPVKLIFIHHSCGGNWLADIGQHDQAGGLGMALRDNNYYVSAANYGWGPDGIGDNTDIGHWWDWFRGPNRDTIMAAVYAESGQNFGDYGSWSRLSTDPGGENEIIMFKSCYPNSGLGGSPTDPPTTGDNPLRGQAYDSANMTVANAKGIYNDLLVYFAAHPDKLFIAVTAPAMIDADTNATEAANARAFNDWLADEENGWLKSYTRTNVAVFDFYNVLTSNGGDVDTNDAGQETGNHHRWRNNAVQHIHTVNNNFSAYASDGDSHPHAAGNLKATTEFVPLLNVYYNRWQGGGSTPTAPTLSLVAPNGGERWQVNTPQQIKWTTTGAVTQVNLSCSTNNFSSQTAIASGLSNNGVYTWTTPAFTTTTMRVRVESVISPAAVYDVSAADFILCTAGNCNYWIYLPIILKNYNPPPTPTPTIPAPAGVISPNDFTYLGAFRLPDDGEKPKTFSYGGNAMTFNPGGDSGKGSLFVMGHDRQPWGDLPDGGQIAEISIPTPVSSTNVSNLNTAAFLQNFSNVADGYFTDLEELPRIGMAYLNNSATGAKIHLSWGQHHKPDISQPSYAWFDPNLSTPDLQGLWYIGNQDWYSLNGYMFEIPASWADAHAGGKYLATGRQMDGGWGGMGPSLFAYYPWQSDGTPEISGTHLSETTLLLYDDTQINGDVVQGAHTLAEHQHPDEWEGGAWLTTASGKAAVLFAGNKGTGAKYWYGYRNPAGAEYPCVNHQAATEFTACRLADGSACPAEDMVECAGHTSAKGWWAAQFTPQFILYNPADLAKVAAGTMEAWEPQPYAALNVGGHIFDNPDNVDLEMLGEGEQRRYLFGGVAFDRANGRLYVLELFADEAKPVVHVWQITD